MEKILLIEDDYNLSEKLKESLEKWQYEVYLVEDFSNCLASFQKSEPQLVIMDITLPVYDGYYWCKKIRDISNVPILFLSSRDSDVDMIMGMRIGGDDYVKKPFSMDVLIAKIHAILRRSYDYKESNESILTFNEIILYLNRSQLSYNDEAIELTKNELRILALLIEQKNKIVSRSQMMHALWDDDQFVNENTLTVNLNRLRHKLQDLVGKDYIQTKKGLGYSLKVSNNHEDIF